MKPFCKTWGTGAITRPVLPVLVVFLLAAGVVTAQKNQRARVTDSILGVRIGASLEDAHERLDRLSAQRPAETREAEADAEESEEEGGRKEAWKLKGTNYATVVLQANQAERVVWITGWLRAGREIPFSKLGSLSSASSVTDSRAIWNIATGNGGYRLVAKGQKGRARVISLFALPTTAVQ